MTGNIVANGIYKVKEDFIRHNIENTSSRKYFSKSKSYNWKAGGGVVEAFDTDG